MVTKVTTRHPARDRRGQTGRRAKIGRRATTTVLAKPAFAKEKVASSKRGSPKFVVQTSNVANTCLKRADSGIGEQREKTRVARDWSGIAPEIWSVHQGAAKQPKCWSYDPSDAPFSRWTTRVWPGRPLGQSGLQLLLVAIYAENLRSVVNLNCGKVKNPLRRIWCDDRHLQITVDSKRQDQGSTP